MVAARAQPSQPDLTAWEVGDPAAPSLGSPDPVLLDWCAEHNFMLLTNNRRSMPAHLADQVAQGRHVPGIFTVRNDMDIHLVVEQLILILGASLPDEYQDQIRYLPLT